MKFNRNAIIIMTLSMTIMVIGCCNDDPEPKPFVCGCDAQVTDTTFTDLPSLVIATSKGYYLLSVEKGFMNVCNSLPNQYQQEGLMVRASGSVKSTCKMLGNPYGINETSVQIDNIQITTDSVFKAEGFTLRIIKSEDYGYDPGFGYAITTPGSDLLQPHQPAISGFQPFRTPLHAYKVGGLVLHKMVNGLHWAIAQEDLVMLQTL